MVIQLVKSIILIVLTSSIVYSTEVMAWEDWEQRLIDIGCHRFEEKPVNNEYIRCLKEQFKATGSGKERIKRVEKTDSSIYACAEDKNYRSCEISLIATTNHTVLTISIDRDLKSENSNGFFPSVTIDAYNLGDKCSCEIEEWGIETDSSIIHGWGLWHEKESVPVINMLRSATQLNIHAAIPHAKKYVYRESFSHNQLKAFQQHISKSIEYLQDGK